MSVHVDYVLMADKTDKLKNIKEKINKKFNIQEYEKVKKFIRVYYEWGCDTKGTNEKITMEKGAKKLVEGYKKYTGRDIKDQKTPGAPCTTLSKSDLE